MTEKEKALASVGETGFVIADKSEARETMLAAFDQLGVTQSLLQRIKIPSGGMTAFMVEDLEGESAMKTLDVILVAIKGRQKAWWRSSMEEGGGGAPPSCASTDGIHGFGNNTLNEDGTEGQHLCSECPWSKFGSNRGGGNGKDCKDFSVLFFFRPGSRIPAVMNVPATSLRNLQNYVLRLIDAGKRYEGVVTRLSLSQAKSASNITYSRLEFSYVNELPAASVQEMAKVSKEFMERIKTYDSFAAADSQED